MTLVVKTTSLDSSIKEKEKKEPAPRCRAFRRTLYEGELTVNVTAFMSLMNRIRYRNNVLFLSETTLVV